jgi:hypothetical protein
MNERIQKLAKQARQIGEYVNYGQIRLSPKQFEQKFAELIVRECLSIADKHGAYNVMDSIIDHFGVKQ